MDSLEDIPISLMLDVLRDATFLSGDWERAAVAEKIHPGAGDYLPNHMFRSVIRDEISDLDVRNAIEARKKYVERRRHLLPSILTSFSIDTDHSIRSIVLRLDDCCHDFPLIASSRSEKRSRKETISSLHSTMTSLALLIEELKNSNWQVDLEYAAHQQATQRVNKEAPENCDQTHKLIADLRAYEFSIRSVLLRDQLTEEKLVVSNNRKNNFIVRNAHEMCHYHGGPPLVTTPGSDFSILCSLIHELASGVEGESLSGAINRYARSDERREFETEAQALDYADTPKGQKEYESDNFNGVKEQIERHKKELEFWQHAMAETTSSDPSADEFAIRVIDLRERITHLSKTHGPFLVWAHQMVVDFDAQHKLEVEHNQKILRLEKETGDLRRSHKN